MNGYEILSMLKTLILKCLKIGYAVLSWNYLENLQVLVNLRMIFYVDNSVKLVYNEVSVTGQICSLKPLFVLTVKVYVIT